MTTSAGINLHFDADDIGRHFKPGENGYSTIDIGRPGYGAYAHLHFRDTAAVDAAIRELAALKSEMLAAPDEPVTDRARQQADDAEFGHIDLCGGE